MTFDNNSNDSSWKQGMPVYESKFFLVKKLYLDRIKTAINFAKISDDFKLIDIGCSRGHLLKTIRNFNKKCDLWGVDIEPKIMNLKISNCKFEICNVNKLPFENEYFDIVFALSTLEHVPDLSSAIKEIWRVLKPGGSAIISSPTESKFYKFCRFLLFGAINDVHIDKLTNRTEADHHYHNVYEIEKKFLENHFRQIKKKSLPGFPIPPLHRLTMFQKKP